jgi:hypothetical protein
VNKGGEPVQLDGTEVLEKAGKTKASVAASRKEGKARHVSWRARKEESKVHTQPLHKDMPQADGDAPGTPQLIHSGQSKHPETQGEDHAHRHPAAESDRGANTHDVPQECGEALNYPRARTISGRIQKHP